MAAVDEALRWCRVCCCWGEAQSRQGLSVVEHETQCGQWRLSSQPLVTYGGLLRAKIFCPRSKSRGLFGVIAVIALPSPVPRQHPLGLLRPPTRCLSHAAHSGALAATRRGCDRRSGPGPVHHRRTPLVAVKPLRCAPAGQRNKLLRLQNMRPAWPAGFHTASSNKSGRL